MTTRTRSLAYVLRALADAVFLPATDPTRTGKIEAAAGQIATDAPTLARILDPKEGPRATLTQEGAHLFPEAGNKGDGAFLTVAPPDASARGKGALFYFHPELMEFDGESFPVTHQQAEFLAGVLLAGLVEKEAPPLSDAPRAAPPREAATLNAWELEEALSLIAWMKGTGKGPDLSKLGETLAPIAHLCAQHPGDVFGLYVRPFCPNGPTPDWPEAGPGKTGPPASVEVSRAEIVEAVEATVRAYSPHITVEEPLPAGNQELKPAVAILGQLGALTRGGGERYELFARRIDPHPPGDVRTLLDISKPGRWKLRGASVVAVDGKPRQDDPRGSYSALADFLETEGVEKAAIGHGDIGGTVVWMLRATPDAEPAPFVIAASGGIARPYTLRPYEPKP